MKRVEPSAGFNVKILAMEDAVKLKPGECVWCRIEAPEPGGYFVSVPNGLRGFLPSTQPIEIGRVVPTTFVCMNDDRALFTFAFTMGTSAKVQHSTLSDQENAFSVWVDAYPRSYTHRRAVDLIMPPLDKAAIMLKLDEQKALEVFPSVEETGFTGCMKIYCQSSLSRTAMIFYNGRVVGSVYTRKPFPDPHPFEIGIRKMLEDVTAKDTDAELEMYELPAEIILSMSALFLGCLDQPEEVMESSGYAELMMEHFSQTRETACFNLVDESTELAFALGFVSEGRYLGSYEIEERRFSEGRDGLFKLLLQKENLKLQAHILPSVMKSDAIKFGYNLNSDQFMLKK